MAAGILVYFINFFTGKSKNARVASAWFDAHKARLIYLLCQLVQNNA